MKGGKRSRLAAAVVVVTVEAVAVSVIVVLVVVVVVAVKDIPSSLPHDALTPRPGRLLRPLRARQLDQLDSIVGAIKQLVFFLMSFSM